MSNPPKRNFLLCLDAFGTIFTPRSPIASQYGQVARSFGVRVSDEEVGREFKRGEFHILRIYGLVLGSRDVRYFVEGGLEWRGRFKQGIDIVREGGMEGIEVIEC